MIEASDKVLMAFDAELQAKALETLRDKPLVDVLLKAGVKEVSEGASWKQPLALALAPPPPPI